MDTAMGENNGPEKWKSYEAGEKESLLIAWLKEKEIIDKSLKKVLRAVTAKAKLKTLIT